MAIVFYTAKKGGDQLSISLDGVLAQWSCGRHWAQSGAAGTSPETSSGRGHVVTCGVPPPAKIMSREIGLVPMLLIEYGPRTAVGWDWTWFQQLLPPRCLTNPPPVAVPPCPSWAQRRRIHQEAVLVAAVCLGNVAKCKSLLRQMRIVLVSFVCNCLQLDRGEWHDVFVTHQFGPIYFYFFRLN